jgi:hypothetical protein
LDLVGDVDDVSDDLVAERFDPGVATWPICLERRAGDRSEGLH